MQFAKSLLVYSTVILLASAAMNAQQAATSSTTAIVPRLVNFSGKATNPQGKPIAGIAGITFSIYKDQYGGAPLWMETQNVTADAKGNYTVQLGASSAEGLPLDLFTSGEARWLGVRVNDNEEQPRVLLLSVPYALKAADAQTLGGLPPSAFMPATPPSASATTTMGGSKAASVTPAASSDVTTTGGTVNRIPLFTAASNIQNSILTQTGTTAVNVGGDVILPALGHLELGGKLFAFGTYANNNAFLGFAGNTTMTGGYNTASGVDALLKNTTGIENTATGYAALQDNSAAAYNTATGYAALQSNTGNFNTATGVQALYSNGSGYQNTATGVAALYANTTGHYNTAAGLDALRFNTTGSSNTANGYSALYSNTAGSYNTAVGANALSNSNATAANDAFGYQALTKNTTGLGNAAFGYQALYSNATGNYNTASGYQVLYNNTGAYNTASGWNALNANTSGEYNAALGTFALSANTTGNNNTATGDDSGFANDGTNVTGSNDTFVGAGSGMSTGSLAAATAIGTCALVSANFSLVLGAPAGSSNNQCGTFGANTKVGIDVGNPSNILTVLHGGGNAIADGWSTYSSRRWKTNIHSLDNALSEVEQLRGVSYDLKDSGKHEIGVIAEEVGQVVPEIVSYEQNGKDATGVDYSRLTALLIEAVKQQQREISVLRRELQRRAAKEGALESRLKELEQHRAETQLASAHPVH